MKCVFILTVFPALCVWIQAVMVTDHVYMNIKMGKKNLGKVVFALFGKNVPKTVANFKGLCTKGDAKGRTYKGSPIHRVIKEFVIQGGDIVSGDGFGSTSIYGEKFDDEDFNLTHSEPGILTMGNTGPNTNGCQFCILMADNAPWLDGVHVIFGKVVEGFDKVLVPIEKSKTLPGDKPEKPITITDCGIGKLPKKKPYNLELVQDIFNNMGNIPMAF